MQTILNVFLMSPPEARRRLSSGESSGTTDIDDAGPSASTLRSHKHLRINPSRHPPTPPPQRQTKKSHEQHHLNGLGTHRPGITDECIALSTTLAGPRRVGRDARDDAEGAAGVGAVLAYYAGLAEDRGRSAAGRGPVDYYLDPDEPAGRWWGGAAPRSGLDGEVDRRRAAGAARGPAPRHRTRRWVGGSGTRRLGGSTRRSRPRSRSRCCGRCRRIRWVRAEVLAAHDAAVDAALGWFETPRGGDPAGHRRRAPGRHPRV